MLLGTRKFFALFLAFSLLELSYPAKAGDANPWPASLLQSYTEYLRQKETLTWLLKERSYSDEVSAEKITAQKTSVKQSFHSYQALEENKPKDLPAWMQAIGLEEEHLASDEALSFLRNNYPKAKRISPLEWQAIYDLLGSENEENFLKKTYDVRELSPANATNVADNKPANKTVLLFIHDPFPHFAKEIWSTNQAEVTNYFRNSNLETEVKDLQKLGHTVEIYEGSAFASIEQEAAELDNFLVMRGYAKGVPVVLLSSGEGSAIVHKMLDLNPSMRKSPEILAWVNYNGRLYGLQLPEDTGRTIASQKTVGSNENSVFYAVKSLEEDRKQKAMPLGPGFAIYNVVHWSEDDRPAENLRDSLEDNSVSYSISGVRQKGELHKVLTSIGY